jgi:hypothetical protein
MTPRLHIASLIYPHLLIRDFPASTENSMRNAHRALMFADALLLCDQQSAPVEVDRQVKPRHPRDGTTHSSPPGLADRLTRRRGSSPTLH